MAKNELLGKVGFINKLCGYKPREINAYRLDIAYGGYRLTQLVNDAGGETDISPRLKANEMREYLDGFRAGFLACGDARRIKLTKELDNV
tara:strand:- start:3053 stop:3322 length:270 start_codon:yes stop_codon:yes gene_type:complete